MTFINVMMHLGTLIAVIAVFWRDILALFRKPFKTLLMLIVATIPAGVVGLFFKDEIEAWFDPQVNDTALLNLAVCFAVTGLLLLVAELIAKRQKQPRPLGWGQFGCHGAHAGGRALSGISRSGSTIVAGTVTGAKREDVAKFSFLMSIPVILVASLLKCTAWFGNLPPLPKSAQTDSSGSRSAWCLRLCSGFLPSNSCSASSARQIICGSASISSVCL